MHRTFKKDIFWANIPKWAILTPKKIMRIGKSISDVAFWRNSNLKLHPFGKIVVTFRKSRITHYIPTITIQCLAWLKLSSFTNLRNSWLKF